MLMYFIGCLVTLGIIWYLNKHHQGDIGIGLTIIWALFSWVLPVILLLLAGSTRIDEYWRKPK